MASEPASESAPAEVWRALIDYHLHAVQRESVPGPVPVKGEKARWLVVEDLVREDLITGRGDEMPLTAALDRFFDAAASNRETVFYGWPLVVVAGARRELLLAPLLIVAWSAGRRRRERRRQVCQPMSPTSIPDSSTPNPSPWRPARSPRSASSAAWASEMPMASANARGKCASPRAGGGRHR